MALGWGGWAWAGEQQLGGAGEPCAVVGISGREASWEGVELDAWAARTAAEAAGASGPGGGSASQPSQPRLAALLGFESASWVRAEALKGVDQAGGLGQRSPGTGVTEEEEGQGEEGASLLRTAAPLLRVSAAPPREAGPGPELCMCLLSCFCPLKEGLGLGGGGRRLLRLQGSGLTAGPAPTPCRVRAPLVHPCRRLGPSQLPLGAPTHLGYTLGCWSGAGPTHSPSHSPNPRAMGARLSPSCPWSSLGRKLERAGFQGASAGQQRREPAALAVVSWGPRSPGKGLSHGFQVWGPPQA